MKKENIKILVIETSCDETAAAVIGVQNGQPKILSNIVSSQIDLHAKTGGIVPEVASRAHMEAIVPVVEEALQQAKSSRKSKVESRKFNEADLLEGITHIAVTNGPGLIGSLLVGFNAAKTIAYAKQLPFIPVNHIEGHIYSALAQNKVESRKSKVESDGAEFPILALTVSGGHTSLTIMRDHGVYETIGETIDDAAGEAFDKVAKLLGLGYPGGPVVSNFASNYREKGVDTKIKFPRPLMDKPNFDFSFSGLKTAVLTEVIKNGAKTESRKAEICYAFEEAAVEVLGTKTLRAAYKYRPKSIILAGGVAANRRLQEELKRRIDKYNNDVDEKDRTSFLVPGDGMTGDNAAMIGVAAYYHIIKGDIADLFSATVDSNAAL